MRLNHELVMTDHAIRRKQQGGVRREGIEAVIEYGRTFYRHGAVLHFLGRKEVAACRRMGINLSDYVNLHVIVQGSVITIYRNRKLNR